MFATPRNPDTLLNKYTPENDSLFFLSFFLIKIAMNYHMKWAFESQIGIHMYSFYESNHHDIFLVGSHELLLRIEPLTELCTHEINNANRYEMVAPCFLGTQKTIRCSPIYCRVSGA